METQASRAAVGVESSCWASKMRFATMSSYSRQIRTDTSCGLSSSANKFKWSCR